MSQALCPICSTPQDLASRITGDGVLCNSCGHWYTVRFIQGGAELTPVRSYEDRLFEWMATGERGSSSNAIAMCLHFGKTRLAIGFSNNYPHDPSDFRRCVLLLQAVPEFRATLPLMANVSPVWAALVARWGEIETLLLEEADGDLDSNWRAPRTYDLMQNIIKVAEASSEPTTL